MFVVPTRALVAQQSAYIRKHTYFNSRPQRSIRVYEVCGDVIDSWREVQWRDALASCDVMVGTAEVFRQCLVDWGYFQPSAFSLIIFDECHNATGNSPMAAIMLDSVSRYYASGRDGLPRVLGLTASFVNGRVGAAGSSATLERKRVELCKLLMATMCTPDTTSDFTGSPKTYHKVPVPLEPVPLDKYMSRVKGAVKELLNSVPGSLISVQHRNKWIDTGWKLFSALGTAAFSYWLREGIFLQLRAKAESLCALSTEVNCTRLGQSMLEALTTFDRTRFSGGSMAMLLTFL